MHCAIVGTLGQPAGTAIESCISWMHALSPRTSCGAMHASNCWLDVLHCSALVGWGQPGGAHCATTAVGESAARAIQGSMTGGESKKSSRPGAPFQPAGRDRGRTPPGPGTPVPA